MGMKIRLPRKSDLLFLLGYALYLMYEILNYSFFSVYFSGFVSWGILLVCLGLFVANELVNGRLNMKKVLSFFAIALMAVTGIYLRLVSFAFMIIVIFFGRNADFKQICRVTTVVTLMSVALVIVSAKLGIITDYVGVRGDGTTRSYLGFRYVLFGPGFLLNALSAYIYYKDSRLGLIRCALFFAIGLYIYKLTNARLLFLLTVVTLFLAMIFGRKRRVSKLFSRSWLSKWIIPVYPVCLVVSIAFAVLYNPANRYWSKLDDLLTWRLQYSQKSLMLYGVRLLGNPNIEWAGFAISADGTTSAYTADMVYVDNVFLHVLQRYGIIFTLLAMIGLTCVMYILYKRKDTLMQMLFVVMAMHGMIDNQVMYLYFNVFLFAVYTEIMRYHRHGVVYQFHVTRKGRNLVLRN